MDNNRISFGSTTPVIDIPDLLDIQKETFENFVQHNSPPDKRKNKGLQHVFTSNFPIFDNKENYRLDYIQYSIEQPRFTVVECLERGLTYSAPLKGKLRLSTKDPDTEEFVNTVEQEVYLGNVPGILSAGQIDPVGMRCYCRQKTCKANQQKQTFYFFYFKVKILQNSSYGAYLNVFSIFSK